MKVDNSRKSDWIALMVDFDPDELKNYSWSVRCRLREYLKRNGLGYPTTFEMAVE